jgi:putative transposase
MKPDDDARIILVEQHVVKAGDEGYEAIDAASFAAKNLYNLGNYTIRQSFFAGDGFISYNRLYKLLKETEAYRALPCKVGQWVLR